MNNMRKGALEYQRGMKRAKSDVNRHGTLYAENEWLYGLQGYPRVFCNGYRDYLVKYTIVA